MRLVTTFHRYMTRTWFLLGLLVGGLVIGALIGRAVFANRQELAYRFVRGERLRYQIEYSGSATADMNAALSGQTAGEGAFSSQVVLKGELLLDVLENKEGRILVAYSFPKLAVTLSVNDVLRSEDS